MKNKQNISSVAQSRLCNTCGACFGVCPAEAIHYEETLGGYYLPVVDEQACNHCRLCREICPGIHFGDTLMSAMPENPFAGCALETFVGKATDKKIYYNSQSGGIVTALLVNAMEKRLISGAVTVSMLPGSPPRPIAKIAVSRQEILQAQKSKYCPVPVLGCLKELKNHEGHVAVVGTSCQIHALNNVLDKKPKLHEKIAFTIGLVCERVLTYSALDYFIYKTGIDKSETSGTIYYKDKAVSGYPGDIHFCSTDGSSVVMPAKIRMQVKDFFTPARCRLCFDKMNVFSDITVGDPHGLDGIDRDQGESMLVIRTQLGRDIVSSARNAGAINIRPSDYEQVLKGQNISKKRKQWKGYSLAWVAFGKNLPDFYDRVKMNAGATPDNSKYKKNLSFSLKIDAFDSRTELIRFVDKLIQKKQTFQKLLFPMRLATKILKKIILIFSKG